LTAEGAPSDRDDLVVTVVYPPLDVAPVASSRLVLHGEQLYAALPDFDQVAIVKAGVVSRYDVCDRPVSLAAGVDDPRVLVACRDGVFALSEDGTLESIYTGDFTAVLMQGGIWGLQRDGMLHGPSGVQAALPGRVLVGSDGAVSTAAFKSPVDHGLWWDGTEHRLVRDPGPDSDTNTRGTPNLLDAGAMRPDGGLLVWGGLKSNTERGLFVEGTAFAHDNAVRAVLKTVDPFTGEEQVAPLFDNRDAVSAVAFTPMGDKLLVAHRGARVVDILDAYSMQRVGGFQNVGLGLDGIVTDGTTVWVLASHERSLISFDLTQANAQVELDRVSLVDEEALSADVLLGLQLFHDSGDPRMAADAYISCASCHPDGEEDGRVWDFTQRGEGLRNTQSLRAMPPSGPFHWTANFDELQDFENDIRLHQGGTGYLTDDDWAELEEPLEDPKAGRSVELDALAAYMRHLAEEGPPPDPAPAPVDAVAVLSEAGCIECHSGPRGTDAAWDGDDPVVHDVGTLTEASGSRVGASIEGLRTPPLVGLSHSAPYLHDGSAATLEAAVEAHVDLEWEALTAVVEALRGFGD
ncbi:MAG TPA: hypothetical protein DFR83_09010, partial [Deltaproteobacteria bacterium]|nr:hypothetical protein [Deltaproteobacteria bacterium]